MNSVSVSINTYNNDEIPFSCPVSSLPLIALRRDEIETKIYNFEIIFLVFSSLI